MVLSRYKSTEFRNDRGCETTGRCAKGKASMPTTQQCLRPFSLNAVYFYFFPLFFSCFVLLFHFLFGFLWLLISVFTTTKQLTVRMKLSFFPIFVSRNK